MLTCISLGALKLGFGRTFDETSCGLKIDGTEITLVWSGISEGIRFQGYIFKLTNS